MLAALLVMGSGWAMNSSGEPLPDPPRPPLPSPFRSDRPIGNEEVKLDSILSRLSDLLREGRSAEADAVIENASGRRGLQDVSYSDGNSTQRRYVWAGDEFGEYVHFAINDSKVRFFIPSICSNVVDRNSDRPTLGQFVLTSPHGGVYFPPGGSIYFEVHCRNNISLRMFVNDDLEQPYVSQIMMFVTPAQSR